MTYETYRYIFIGCLCLSILLLVTAVILFFVLHIPNVIGDLSGANAKKAIEHIRNKNESTGEKTYKSSKVNKERGKLTEKISISGRLHKHTTGSLYGAMPTEKISTQKLTANETTVLNTGFSRLPVTMFYLIVRFLICGLGINLVLALFMCRNQHFWYYVQLLKTLILKKFKI